MEKVYAVGARLTINEVEAEPSSGILWHNNEGFSLLMQESGCGSSVNQDDIVRIQKPDVLLGFISMDDAKEFIKTQAEPAGNLNELIAAALTRELKDKYVFFGGIDAGWIHEFKVEQKDDHSEHLIVHICNDDLNRPMNSYCGFVFYEHEFNCQGQVRGYPFIHNQWSAYKTLEKFEVYNTKVAYLASLNVAYADKKKQESSP